MNKKTYGIELILDLQECDTKKFTRKYLKEYIIQVCRLIGMKQHGPPIFSYYDSNEPHLNGTSAVQFIETSNIVIHAVDMLKAIFVNIFSCKDFDVGKAKKFTKKFFEAKKMNSKVIERVK